MKQQTIETMKTLEQIKEEVSINHGWKSYNTILDAVNAGAVSGFSFADLWEDITERYATEYAKEALRLASVNADTKMQRYNDLQDIIVVDKETILSDYNLPEHR